MFFTFAVVVVVLLMLRCGFIEYRYYQAVKIYEPEIWKSLGSPKRLKVALVFINFENSPLFQSMTNEVVIKLSLKNRQAGLQFLGSLIILLVTSILYFKVA